MTELNQAKRCPRCRRKPIQTFGTRSCRLVCTHCDVGTTLSRSTDDAVGKWNAGKVEPLGSPRGFWRR